MKRLIQESDPVQSDGGDETIRALIADAMRISARTEPSLVNVIFRSYEEKLLNPGLGHIIMMRYEMVPCLHQCSGGRSC